jgi:2-dehydropantoate 2-reductase
VVELLWDIFGGTTNKKGYKELDTHIGAIYGDSITVARAKAIGEKIGIPIAQMPEDRHAVTRKLGAFKTSMLQDVEAGKAVELDALVSVVRELGQLTQVSTPYTDALLGLSRLHAQVHGLYPAK